MRTPPAPTSGDEDARLLARYAAGDRAAAARLVDRFVPRILVWAGRSLADPAEAEDVAQEAMLRLFRQAPRWRADEARVATWLYRVTANLVTDRLRRKVPGRAAGTAAVPLAAVAEPADGAPGAEQRLLAAERLAALRMALAELPERQREAVILRHVEGLSNPEIAARLGTSVEAVESLTARGKRRLAGLLLKRRDELGLDE